MSVHGPVLAFTQGLGEAALVVLVENAAKRTEKSRWKGLPGEGTADSLRKPEKGPS